LYSPVQVEGSAAMKQLYYTSHGRAKHDPESGVNGSRVRAATAGVPADRLQAVVRHAGYVSPGHAPGASPAPVRLALLKTPDAGRILCHSTCLGIDPATGTNGQFFSHMFLELPPTLDAQHAIQTWGSPQWQSADHGGGPELPEALYLPVASVLGDAQLKGVLAHPANGELLQFLLSALLSAKRDSRIFVAAPAEQVALCIYGITRALPPALLADFTFSTYEHDPLSCPARLIGTCWAEPDRDLPDACYAAPNFGFNTYTGRRTEPAPEVPFAEFAVRAMSKGQTSHLDEFQATWQRLGVNDASLFEPVFRLARGNGTLTKEESERILHHPALCAWVAVRFDALGQFLEWALEDPAYATTTFSRAVAALRQKPDALAKLAAIVHQRGLAALREGDLNRTRNALEALMPMVAPAQAAMIWGDLLKSIDNPDALTWDVRGYLLPYLVRPHPLSPGQAPNAALASWLRMPSERVGWLLGLHLPQAYHLAACLACLRQDGEPTPTLARELAGHPGLVLTVLQQLPAEEGKALALFRGVLAEAPGHAWVDDVIRAGKSLPESLLNQCVEAALEAGQVQPRPLVQAHGPALVDLLTGQSSLDRLAGRLFDQPADDLLTERSLVEFFQTLAGVPNLSDPVRSRLEAYLAVLTFLRQPALESDGLLRVAAALRLEPPLFHASVREDVRDAVATAWLSQARGSGVQAELERILTTLGPAWTGGPSGLFRELLRHQLENKSFWRQTEWLHAALAIGLGAPQSIELASQLDNLDAEAYILAQQIARVGGARVLAALDQRTAEWPRAARSQWNFLAKAVRPRGLRDRLRDTCLVSGGVLAGAMGVVILQWLRVF
jgi:hypothetical protein